MTWLLAVLMLQEQTSQADQIRAAMAASLEKQNASVRIQALAVGAGAAIGGSIGVNTPAGSPCSSLSEPDLDKLIAEVSQAEHVDAAILREVARQEPRLRPCPVPKGAEGLVPPKGADGLVPPKAADVPKGPETLVPLTPATPAPPPVQDLSDAKQSLTDAKQSLEAGAKLIKPLLERYHGDAALALGAYNAAKVGGSGGSTNTPETRNSIVAAVGHLINLWP